MLLSFSSKEREPATPPKPQPKPIAVLPSGLSIGEVIARLTELQAEHPDAEVRRGRANRWEIWPQPEAPTSTGSEEKST